MAQSEGSDWVDPVSSSSADTDGAWVELIASTAFASKWMVIHIIQDDGGTREALFDIGIGGAGSEVEVISDQFYQLRRIATGSGVGSMYSFPMTVDAGTRISIRIKDNEASARTYHTTLTTSDQTVNPASATASESSGLKTVPSKNSIGEFGSWVELIASLNSGVIWMVFTAYTLPTTASEASFDIGVGANGSEVVVKKDLGFRKFTTSGKSNSLGYYFPIEIASGVRVSVRARDDSASNLDYKVGAVFFEI